MKKMKTVYWKQLNAKRFINNYNCANDNWRNLVLARLQKKTKRKTTREVKSNQMTITEMEKEIIKAIRIEAKIPLASNVGYYNLIKFVKKLFKEYNNE